MVTQKIYGSYNDFMVHTNNNFMLDITFYFEIKKY